MRLRPLEPSDRAAVEHVFRETLAMGRPASIADELLRRYCELCLDWYLGPGLADGAVVEDGGRVVAYALVCTDEVAHGKWERRAAVRFVAHVVPGLALRRWDRRTRDFCRRRLRDGYDLWRAGSEAPARAHAHVNALAGRRTGGASRLLLDHVDARCRARGLTAWYGEVNAVEGRREAALERLGLGVVRVTPNRTLSALTGVPVRRLTVHRSVPLVVVGRSAVLGGRWRRVRRRTARMAGVGAGPRSVRVRLRRGRQEAPRHQPAA